MSRKAPSTMGPGKEPSTLKDTDCKARATVRSLSATHLEGGGVREGLVRGERGG